MPNLNTRRFTNPDILGKIRPASLVTWLTPAKDYLATRGVTLPADADTGPVDLEKLATVFLDPDPDMPRDLVESLNLVNEMATDEAMETILEAQGPRKFTLDVGDKPSPADVAVQTLLLNRLLLEELHNEHQLTRPRSFEYFVCEGDEPPKFTPPDKEQIAALEARLDDWYAKSKRGRGCKVIPFPKEGECWFLVRHGLPCKRESAMVEGESSSVFYRPQKHDVVVYDTSQGELRMNCCGKRELELFRKAFGLHLFGKEEFFPGTGKYRLKPLLKGRGCLACLDIEGMESVTLKEVQFLFGGKPWQRVTRASDDIYGLVEKEKLFWPGDAERIKRATFEIKFAGSKKPRRVTIIPSNKAQYGRDDDSGIIENWLKERGFIGEDDENETDETETGTVDKP